MKLPIPLKANARELALLHFQRCRIMAVEYRFKAIDAIGDRRDRFRDLSRFHAREAREWHRWIVTLPTLEELASRAP